MSYNAYVRIVNKIKHGNSLDYDEPDDLINEIQKLQYESNKQIFKWFDEYSDDIELKYKPFIEAFEECYNKDKYSKGLKELYDQVKQSEDSKLNGYIRIDWD